MLQNLQSDIEHYTYGRKWYLYVPGWIFGFILFVSLCKMGANEPTSLLLAPASALNFTLHELAHIVVGFLPHILVAAAGSFSELLLGAVLIIMAFTSRSYFASLYCFLWAMLSCQNAGIYMADARAQQLPLVSLGGALSGSDEVIHDWHYVFGQLHILAADKFIGYSVRGVGVLLGLFGLVLTGWLIYLMYLYRHEARQPKGDDALMLAAAEATARQLPPQA